MSKNTPPKYLVLGEILRPHGIRGELRVRLLTDYPERIGKLKQVFIGPSPESRKVKAHPVEHIRMHQDYGLLKLHTIQDRNDADIYRGLFVMVSLEDAVPLEDDEVYLFQLIGMSVQTENGEVLGSIIEVIETGANDVYVVKSPQYGEILIPITDETLLNTDTDSGAVTVRLPDGLLPEK